MNLKEFTKILYQSNILVHEFQRFETAVFSVSDREFSKISDKIGHIHPTEVCVLLWNNPLSDHSLQTTKLFP
jgi:hypothetical protein